VKGGSFVVKQIGSVGYESVMAIKDHYPLGAVAVCVELADELGHAADMAGSWILYRARMRVPGLRMPNFKPFVTLGILMRVGAGRGGRRAYYRMVDPEGSKQALLDLGVPFQARTVAAAP
jgi:hypothetical protein